MAAPRSDSDARRSPDRSANEFDWLRIRSNSPAEAAAPPAPSLPAISSLAGYQVIAETARSPLRQISTAIHIATKTPVSLIAWQLAPLTSDARKSFVERLQAISDLNHPNLLKVREARQSNGAMVVATDVMDAGTLDHWRQQQPVTPHQAAALLRSAALALQCAHEHGEVHGSLSPHCIFLHTLQVIPERATLYSAIVNVAPKVAEFGLHEPLAAAPYAAPERMQTAPSPRSDVYGMGAILYELLTGHAPFDGATSVETLELVKSQPPIPPRRLRRMIPAPLETICLTCLEKDPNDRYATAAELAEEFDRFLENKPIRARRRRRWYVEDRRESRALYAVAGLALTTALIAVLAAFLFGYRARRDGAEARMTQLALDREVQSRTHEARLSAIRSALAVQAENDAAVTLLAISQAGQKPSSDESADRIRFRNYQRVAFQPVAAFPEILAGSGRPLDWAIHPSGQWIIVTTDTNVQLFNVDNGSMPRLPSANRNSYRSASWSADGKRLALGYEGGVVITTFPELEKLLELPVTGTASALAFDNDSTRLAVGADAVRVWDFQKGEWQIGSWLSPSPPSNISFDSGGNTLLAAFHNGTAVAWDLRTNQKLIETRWTGNEESSDRRLPQPPRLVRQGSAIATLMAGQLVILEVRTGKQILAVPKNTSSSPAFSCFAVAPGDRRLVAAGPDQSVLVDLNDLRVRDLNDMAPRDVRAAGFLADSTELWFADRDQALLPLDRPTYSRLHHSRPVLAVASIGSDRVATLQDDGFIRIWRKPEMPFGKPWAEARQRAPVQLHFDGKHLLLGGTPAAGDSHREAALFDADTGTAGGPSIVPGGMILTSALSPKQARIALGIVRATGFGERRQRMFDAKGEQATVEMYNGADGQRLWQSSTSAEPRSLVFSPDGGLVAVLTATAEVLVFDASTGALKWKKQDDTARSEPAGPMTSGTLRFSPDGQLLLTWGLDDRLHCWDVSAGTLRYELPSAGGRRLHAEISPDGKSLVTTHESEPVQLRRRDTGREVAPSAFANSAGARSARFTADSQRLLIAGADGAITLWNIPSRKIQFTTMRQTGTLIDAFLIPDRDVVVGINDRSVRIWDGRDGLPLGPELAAPAKFVSAVLSADRRLWLGSDDGRVFQLALDDWLVPAAGDWSALRDQAELAASRRHSENGAVATLRSDEWIERWRRKVSLR